MFLDMKGIWGKQVNMAKSCMFHNNCEALHVKGEFLIWNMPTPFNSSGNGTAASFKTAL